MDKSTRRDPSLFEIVDSPRLDGCSVGGLPSKVSAKQKRRPKEMICGMHFRKKYDTEEAGAKKFAISRYLKFQMVDEKSIEAQSHELQKIAHEIIIEGMNLDEKFQVAVIIDKLPPSWKDFKNALRHKTKEFSLESLITRLRIEEEARKHDMKEEVLLVSNNKKNHNSNRNQTPAALKTNGKNMKNQNRNRNNNQNRNGQHN
ncbi:unnamed protein product [Prunus armeniaca]